MLGGTCVAKGRTLPNWWLWSHGLTTSKITFGKMYSHTHIYICIYIYMCVCVRVIFMLYWFGRQYTRLKWIFHGLEQLELNTCSKYMKIYVNIKILTYSNQQTMLCQTMDNTPNSQRLTIFFQEGTKRSDFFSVRRGRSKWKKTAGTLHP
jgi:hypothetical protein